MRYGSPKTQPGATQRQMRFPLLSREKTLEMIEGAANLIGDAIAEIAVALRLLLAGTFALYVKTRNFHWHMNGSHLRTWIGETQLKTRFPAEAPGDFYARC